MTNKDTPANIGSYFEQFISNQVVNGRYSSGLEVLQAGLRLLEEQELRINLEKSKLDQKVTAADDDLCASTLQVERVSQSVTEAMRALATAASEQSSELPPIPVTKGLLRSQIAAE